MANNYKSRGTWGNKSQGTRNGAEKAQPKKSFTVKEKEEHYKQVVQTPIKPTSRSVISQESYKSFGAGYLKAVEDCRNALKSKKEVKK